MDPFTTLIAINIAVTHATSAAPNAPRRLPAGATSAGSPNWGYHRRWRLRRTPVHPIPTQRRPSTTQAIAPRAPEGGRHR